MQEYPSELDYDCMTLTGRTLSEYADMGPDGLSALTHLVRHVGPDSATWRAVNGSEVSAWATTVKTNAILADIFDMVNLFRAEHGAKGSGHKAKKPKPYARPCGKGGGIGKADMTIADFEDWWKSGE